jgi:S-adenosylmethionine:tRNA ribosyltransferase-isomerase
MKVADFDYHLPEEFIAQAPAEKRDHSKLMILDRSSAGIEHKLFYEIADQLLPGDVLVLNDTKVLPANLTGRKEEGSAKVEVLLARQLGMKKWECLVRPGKRLQVGSRVFFGEGEVIGKVLEKTETGEQIIEFEGDVFGYMHKKGEIPLPPYIRPKTYDIGPRTLEKRYQTVYAEREGASAAPTAGLHFTPELLKKIEASGVKISKVTLHTGLATFKPVYVENVEEHKMYYESYEIADETIDAIRSAKRVVAVGTTTVRALESTWATGKPAHGLTGETNMFIYPGYEFKVVDAIITNFHFPRSTLLMMISAFARKEFIFQAYQEAMSKGYRFFSFGDAMLIK